MLPAWTPSAIPLLESGGTYALAILRGGGEYGESWHRAGMLANKQNVFDDFIAAASWMSRSGSQAADRLAISGGSNGGLLVGAALTQRPELFRAVVCGVPLLDMLRYHLFRIAALWIPSTARPTIRGGPLAGRLLAVSARPRRRDIPPSSCTRGVGLAGRSDARPQDGRAPAGGDYQRPPVLLQVESQAGHGAGKPLRKVIAQLVDQWSFLFSQLGFRTRENAVKKTRVIILFGGRSAEHEISILSARNVLAALDRDRFDPVLVGIDRLGRWHLEPSGRGRPTAIRAR